MNERYLNEEGQWEDRKQWSLGVGQRRKKFWTRYTYIQFATTGSRSNLHRKSVLSFFTFVYLFWDTFKSLCQKKNWICVGLSGDGLAASAHSVPLLVKQSTGRSTIWGLVLPIILRQNRNPLVTLGCWSY
jgi:hypothetical protein